MNELGTEARPFRVAIVGSGPSGFYAADALFKSDTAVHVDMFERLPTPFGLVRAAVAPDHAKAKKVQVVFQKIAEKAGFRFVGNVHVGRDVTLDELRAHYDAIIFASGAQTDRRLGIPGEDLPGSHGAKEFVAWYNGHPDYRDCRFDLSHETAVIIGQGNVAIDLARILAKTTDELKHTDIAQHALDALAESRIRDIYLVGRRGPVQAKFTVAELRELGQLAECAVVVKADDLVCGPVCQQELDAPENQHSRKNFAVLQEFAEQPSQGKPRRCHLVFFRSPVELRGTEKLEQVVLEVNELKGEPSRQRAYGTGELETLDCGLLLRSVGYLGLPIPGVPFDEGAGVFPNADGRLLDGDTPLPGLYAVGWIRRGAIGLIGKNKADSHATVKALLEDLPNLPPCEHPDTAALLERIAGRGVRVVDLDDWRKIDAAEAALGEDKGKPREKFTSVQEMLDVLD